MTPETAKNTKAVVSTVAGLGASTITATVVKNQVHPTGKIAKITVPVGSWFLGSLVGFVVKKHAEDQIDEAIALWKQASAAVKKAQAEKVK